MANGKTLSVGEQIRSARKRAGLSHDRLGAVVGTSRQHLIRLEKGIHQPRDGMLARIAEATGQPLSFFEDGDAEDDEESDPVAALMGVLRKMVGEAIRDGAQA